MIRAKVKPALFQWASDRSGIPSAVLERRFPRLPAWQSGDAEPTLKQLESFARATHAPIGFFFLSAPPTERLPIPDLRSGRGNQARRPSPNLLDTIYLCQQRQEWYRDFARSVREEPRGFVGSLTVRSPIVASAAAIRDALGFDLEARAASPTWEDALRQFMDQADALGILVMRNGVVNNNTHRKLDPDEFRGFALSDALAPLVFVNAADSKAAQMFTLAHELGHIWLGASALDDPQIANPDAGDDRVAPGERAERWCNQVAAELLVPMAVLRSEVGRTVDLGRTPGLLARRFKVSTLVILRRLLDAGIMDRRAFRRAYEAELERLPARATGGGGDFYRTEVARVGKRFATALIANTLEGHTLHLEAFRLLGISKTATFNELGHHLRVLA